MSQLIEVVVPDMGDFKAIPVIEVLVNEGDSVDIDAPLLTLESDKATMDVPAPQAGIVKNIKVAVGDTVSKGSVVLMLETADVAQAQTETLPVEEVATTETALQTQSDSDIQAEVVVLGAGPGGYTAAFRAADLGKKVVLIERYNTLGGVCLNVGCIPSKALLHVAQVINEAEEMAEYGVSFNKPDISREKLLTHKNKVIKQLTSGLAGLAKKRKVEVVHGKAEFTSSHQLQVTTIDGVKTISFENCIIAAGSQATKIPNFPDDKRVMDSTAALALEDIPKKLLVIGGGIIGLEMATVYHALGSEITVAEFTDSLIPAADKDIVRPLQKRINQQYANIYLNTKVTAIDAKKKGLMVSFEGKKAPTEPVMFDRVLVAVGRRPNGNKIGAEKAGVQVDEYGFINVDKQMRTNVPHIFAIGDIVGQPMLAHKAVHEGKVAAEVIAGHKVYFDAKTIPSVAYTDPEVAWMGLTEKEAKAQGIDYEKGAFPWAASGRALSLGRSEGLTKVLFDRDTKQIIGAGIVGTNAGELIAEAVLGLELGADVEDLSLTIHPHPTLSETVNFAAEAAAGTITDLYMPRKKPW